MRSLKVVCAKFAGVRAHPNPGHGIPIAEPNPHHLNTATYCTHTSSEEEHPNQPYKLFPGKTLSLERCFSLDDVHAFCRLCHITDPIRLQISETQSRGYSACVVPELLYSGLFPAIIGTHFPGSIYVSQSLVFKSPVLLGDCLLAEVKAVHLRKIREKFRVEFATSCWKKEGNVLAVEGNAVAVLPSLVQQEVSKYQEIGLGNDVKRE
eukprot:c16066_g1_i1 orf=67-690(-)